MLLNVCKAEGLRAAIYSPENQPLTGYILFLAEKLLRISRQNMSHDDLMGAEYWLDNHFQFVVPNFNKAYDLDWLLEKALISVQRFGIDILVIDPWNEIQSKQSDRQTETQFISECITKLRNFARYL